MAMLGTVLPVVADIVDVDRAIDYQIAIAPVGAAPPPVSARSPATDRVTCAECQACREQRAAISIAGSVLRKVVRRIVGRGPAAKGDRRIVLRHVDSARVGL